jgi:hypothetical protein
MNSLFVLFRVFCGYFLFSLCSLCLCGSLSAEELKAGAATVDITPPVGHAMWGYAKRHDSPSVGVLEPLKARALVLAVGDQRIALVSLDLGRAPTRQSTAAIRKRVKADANVEHVFLVASHTHHGPVIELDNWPTPQTSYVRQLEQKIGDVIVAASKNMKPARLGVAAKDVDFNRNRHSKRQDAPVDRELIVVRIETTDGKPLAHLVNFAAHATLLDAKLLKFSPDYPGALASQVEKETSAPCLFLQSAAGDLSANTQQGDTPEKFGQVLGREVLALAGKIRCAAPAQPTLTVHTEDFQFKSRIDIGNSVVKTALSMAFFRELIDFYEREYKEGIRPQSTVALLDGRIGLVGVSGEFFCGHSLSLKRRARLDHVLFLGYCNDYHQYFPTIEATAEKGYGTDPAVSPAETGAGERIIDQALIQLFKMRGQIPDLPKK